MRTDMLDSHGGSGAGEPSARAAYRPVRIVLAYRAGAGDDGEARARLRLLAGAPAALGHAPAPREGAGADAAADGDWVLHDRAGAFLGTMADADFRAAWRPCPHDALVHHAFDGEALAMEAGPFGLRDASGAPVGDLAAAWRGLARLDAEGGFLVEADAPFAVQGAALAAIEGEGEGGEDVSCAAHLLHLAHGARLLTAQGGLDPAGWLDVELLADVIEASRDGHVPTAWEAAAEGVDRLDGSDRGEPMWLAGPALGILPREWLGRDTPGSGALWALVDARLAQLAPDRVPTGGAQCALSGSAGPRWPGLAGLLAGCEILAARGSDLVARHRREGLALAVVSDSGLCVVVAWHPGDPREAPRDPLMAERLLGLPVDLDGFAGEPDPAASASRELLGGLGLIGALPEPAVFPGYAALALARAHLDGATLPDLCASLAGILRAGGAGTGFGRAIAYADLAGGRPDPLLTALLAGVGPEGLAGLDLDREARLLLDAVRMGATLADLAAAATALGEEDLP